MNEIFKSDKHLFRTWAEIDLDAAENNFLKLKNAAGGRKTCAVIKANAYGHGAVRLGRLYSALGADFLAVSNMGEALELRGAGISLSILILGYVAPECAEAAAKNNITLAVYSLPYAKALSKAASAAGVTLDVHLKFDTGMGRIGFFTSEEGENSLRDALFAARLEGLSVTGAFTHFATADGGDSSEDRDYTLKQAERFVLAKAYMISHGVKLPLCHTSNSAATLDYPDLAHDMVRLGISLYGLLPSFDVKNTLAPEPVMTLKSVISHIKTVEKGTGISYGRTFIAEKTTRVATVPIGYADGFFRSSSASGVRLTVRGKDVSILGRVCMDQLMIDITDVPDVELFDEVVIYGAGAFESADSFALKNGTIGYECVCAVSHRVPRIYLKSGACEFILNYLEE